MYQFLINKPGTGSRLFLFLLLFPALLFSLLNTAAADAANWLYTIQAGAFPLDDLTGAGKRFMLLSQLLGKKERADLRIEQTGKQFLVRVGQFSSAADAQRLLKKVVRSFSGANLTRLEPEKFWRNKVFIAFDEKSLLRMKQTHAASLAKTSRTNAPASAGLADALPEPLETEKSDALLNDISRFFGNREYEKVSELIRQGIRRWPDRPEFYAWHGASLLDRGRSDEALVQYRKAAELMPNVPEYHAGSGFSLLNIYVDRAKQSMAAFEKALSFDPDNVNALEGLGIVYSSIGQRTQAEELYQRLIHLDRDAAARLAEYIRWGIDWRK